MYALLLSVLLHLCLAVAHDVLVIGAGPSGIVAAHYFKQQGFSVSVAEKSQELGGVWAPSNHYPLLFTNNPRENFFFPDRKINSTFPDYLSQENVHTYLNEYVDEFDLRSSIHFGVHVKEVRRDEDPGRPFGYSFHVSFHAQTSLLSKYDFVVFATGQTSVPKRSAVGGRDVFLGIISHSSEVKRVLVAGHTQPLSHGKNVVVVGGGKSAADIVTWAATEGGAATTHWVLNRPHTLLTRYIGSNDPEKGTYAYDASSRFGEGFMPAALDWLGPLPLPPVTMLQRTWWARSFCRLFWTLVGKSIADQLEIPPELRPASVYDDLVYAGLAPPALFPLISAGKVHVHVGAHAKTLRDTVVEITNSSATETIACDVYIEATGFSSSLRGILQAGLQELAFNDAGQLNLHRGGYIPTLPGMSFVGYKHCFNTMMSSALTARWAVEYAKGTRGALHRTGAIKNSSVVWASIHAAHAFEDNMLASQDRSSYSSTGMVQGAAMTPYADAILRDLGLEAFRGDTWQAELFSPIPPSRYAALHVELEDPSHYPLDPARSRQATMIVGAMCVFMFVLLPSTCCLLSCYCAARACTARKTKVE